MNFTTHQKIYAKYALFAKSVNDVEITYNDTVIKSLTLPTTATNCAVLSSERVWLVQKANISYDDRVI